MRAQTCSLLAWLPKPRVVEGDGSVSLCRAEGRAGRVAGAVLRGAIRRAPDRVGGEAALAADEARNVGQLAAVRLDRVRLQLRN